ncbi:MAG: vWA domain-containing protein, partial [Acidimicrobiales bacterium]
MLEILTGFVAALREAGLPVSLTEAVDAAEAVVAIGVLDRALFKAALGATLVKAHAYWPVFDVIFEVYFALRGPEHAINLGGGPDGSDGSREGHDGEPGLVLAPGRGRADHGPTADELAGLLYAALLAGDAGAVGALARRAVTLFAGMEQGRPVGGSYYLFRTLRSLDLDGLATRMMDATRAGRAGRAGRAAGDGR